MPSISYFHCMPALFQAVYGMLMKNQGLPARLIRFHDLCCKYGRPEDMELYEKSMKVFTKLSSVYFPFLYV